MDVLIYVVAFGGFAGVAIYGAFLGVMYSVNRFRELKAEVAVLEKDNLQLARNNKALRELLNK